MTTAPSIDSITKGFRICTDRAEIWHHERVNTPAGVLAPFGSIEGYALVRIGMITCFCVNHRGEILAFDRKAGHA